MHYAEPPSGSLESLLSGLTHSPDSTPPKLTETPEPPIGLGEGVELRRVVPKAAENGLDGYKKDYTRAPRVLRGASHILMGVIEGGADVLIGEFATDLWINSDAGLHSEPSSNVNVEG
jgi:hypothetical protein